MARAEGITTRHSRSCGSHRGSRCSCQPTYQAAAWDPKEKRRLYKTFDDRAAAVAWRTDSRKAIREGKRRAVKAPTLSIAGRELLAGMRAGSIRTAREGQIFKPSVIRSYENALKKRLLPALGRLCLSDIDQRDLARLVEQWLGDGLDPSTIHNTLMPLRVIYRRAMKFGEVAVNPAAGLELPKPTGTRDRIAAPGEAAALLAALPVGERALWATAVYTGLRRGELLGLDWSAVDFERNVIRVERSWDLKAGPIEPKSENGKRAVPLPTILRSELIAHRLRQGRGGRGLVFGTGRMKMLDDCEVEQTFNPATAQRRADKAWTAAKTGRITLHEARHSYASFLIDAGFNVKKISTYLGHASVVITLDRYGHLMPEHEADARVRLDGYLANALSDQGLDEATP